MAKEQLFDDDILLDNEGNVIENGNENENDEPTDIDTDDLMVDEKGNVLGKDGKPIEEPSEEDDKEDEGDNEKDKDKKSGNEDPASTEDRTTDTLPPFAKALKEAGVLPDFDINEEGVTAEALIEAVREQVKKNELSDLDDNQRELLGIIRSGGDVSKYLDYYQKGVQAKEQFKEITNDNAEAFTREYFTMKGLSQEEIDDIIDDRVINGTLLEKAKRDKEPYNKLLEDKRKEELTRTEQQKLKEQKEIEENLGAYKKIIDSADEFIKGTKLTQAQKEKIYDLGTKPVTTKDGQPMTALQKAMVDDPLGMEAKLNYLYLVTDGFKKMDNLSYSKTSKTTAIQELEEKLEQERNRGKGLSSPKNKTNNKPSILSAIDSGKL